MTNQLFLNFSQKYQDFLDSGDPRVSGWPLMDSPVKGATMVVAYLTFVKVVGPSWMRDQKPYDLRYLMVAYNFALVAVSAWIFLTMGTLGWFSSFSWRCQAIDYSYNPDALRIAEVGWYYYITKFVEFADTIFFILRKKDSQISVLHVFHHSLVPITLWFGIKFGAGGYNSIFAFLNSFVHIWMYLYYGLSALGPSFQKYLWWKKYLTMLQLVQFIVVFAFTIQLALFPTCEVSTPMVMLNMVQAVIFFGLFLNFYLGSYLRGRKRRHQQQQQPPPATATLNSKMEQPTTNGHVRFRKNGGTSIQKSCATSARYVEVDYLAEQVTISA